MNKLILVVGLVMWCASAPSTAAFRVFACEPEWAALAKEIGGTDVDIYSATTAKQDVHKIQARPSLIAKFRQANLVICTGAELEIGWLPALIEKANNPKVIPGSQGFLEASHYVQMKEVPVTVDRAMGDVHPFGNPHIQTSPDNIAAVGRALADRLAALDAPHAEAYRRRHAEFGKRWAEATQRWKTTALPLKDVPVVSFHRSWVYLYDWLGVREVAALEPKPGIAPSAAHLNSVLQGLAQQPARMIVFAAYQDRRPVQWLAGKTSLPVAELPYTVGGASGTDDLFGLFDVTVQRLLDAAAKSGKS